MSVRLHDKHIWDPLKKTKARLIYFSEKDSCKEFNKIKGDRVGDITISSNFDHAFDSICALLSIQ